MADGPTLQHVLAGQHEGSVTCSMFVTEVGGTGGDTGVLTTAEDKVLLVWLLRDNGEYYPSARKDLPAVGRTISFDQDANRIYVGLDDGKIMVRKPRPRCLLQTSPPPSLLFSCSLLFIKYEIFLSPHPPLLIYNSVAFQCYRWHIRGLARAHLHQFVQPLTYLRRPQ